MRVIILRALLLLMASAPVNGAKSQGLYPGYKTVVDAVAVGRYLFVEGFSTQDQSAEFTTQYLNKQGFTGARVKNISQQKTFEADVDLMIKSSGGCGRITREVLGKPVTQ